MEGGPVSLNEYKWCFNNFITGITVSYDNTFSSQETLRRSINRMAQIELPIVEENLSMSTCAIKFPDDLPREFIQAYSTNDSEPLLAALLLNHTLVSVTYPDWFFSEEQKARLNAHLQPHIEAQRLREQNEERQKPIIENFNNNNRFRHRIIAAFGAISVGAAIVVSSVPTFSTILTAVVFALSTYMLSNVLFVIRGNIFAVREQEYLNGRISSVSERNDPLEIDALKSGVNAKSWCGYAKSFFKSSGYLNYATFGGAMNRAVKEDEAFVAQVNALRVR